MTSTQNILVVDDDPDLLQAMSRLLTRAGYGVIEAGTATEALRLAREQRPDLALLDLVLPDLDGIALSRRFQTDPDLAATAVILISSFRTSAEDQAAGLEAGVCEYLARPMSNREFLARIAAVAEQQRAREVLRAERDQAVASIDQQDRQRAQAEAALDQEMAAGAMTRRACEDLQEELQAIFNGAPICLFVTSGDARLLTVNPALAELFQRDAEAMNGQPCGAALRCVHARDVAEGCGFGPSCASCKIRQTIVATHADGAQRRQVETRLNCRANGEIVQRVVSLSASVIPLAGESRVLVSLEDITEKKQTEQALRDSVALLKQAESVAHLGSWQWDVTTDRMTWSDELFRIFNRDPAQGAPGYVDHHRLFPPEDLAREQAAVTAAVLHGTPYQLELRAIRTDGAIRHCLASGYPERGADGTVDRLFGSVQDITELKQAEEQRKELELRFQQAQKMESIGRLAGGVAHDFNNMLSVILGYGEQLLDQFHPQDPLREDVRHMVEAAKRSAAITRQLLAFSRRQTLQPEVLDLNEVIRNLAKMLRRLIGEDIELELVLAEDLAPVLADRLRRSQPQLKILYMSGYTDDAIAQHGVLEPGTPFIQKPFGIRDLTAKVQGLLNQSGSDRGTVKK